MAGDRTASKQSLHGGRFGDPVHGYVEFTPLERLILDHRVAQRLRNISQTGLVQYVYPEARTSRFSHSLGTMHVASQFLAACFRNSQEVRGQLGAALVDVITQKTGRYSLPAAARELVDDALLARHYCAPTTEHQQATIIVEQALRLAALFHDLGHLPLSHDFEEALEDYWNVLPRERQAHRENAYLSPLFAEPHKGHGKAHENIGHQVGPLVLKDVMEDPRCPSNGAQVVFELTESILQANPKIKEHATDAAAALSWLHSLIDGELDADRCDYILRDARNYGFTFANYDLARLLDNMMVLYKDGAFSLTIMSTGLSSVESLLVARYRSYQYSVQHPKVSQVGIALRHAIIKMLSDDRPREVNKLLADIPLIMDNKNIANDAIARQELLYRFATYDDMWWMMLMRSYLEGMRRGDADKGWLELVCWRKPGPETLWKRVDDFPTRINGSPVTLREFNKLLPQSFESKVIDEWVRAEHELRKQNVLVLRRTFVPWTKKNGSEESVLSIMGRDKRMVPVSRASPLVHALWDAWLNDVQVRAFAQSDSGVTKEEVSARLWRALQEGREQQQQEKGQKGEQ